MQWSKRNILNVHILCTEFDEAAIAQILARSGIDDGRRILETDFAGFIQRFVPTGGMQWVDVWYIQNLCIMQRLHLVDSRLKELEARK